MCSRIRRYRKSNLRRNRMIKSDRRNRTTKSNKRQKGGASYLSALFGIGGGGTLSQNEIQRMNDLFPMHWDDKVPDYAFNHRDDLIGRVIIPDQITTIGEGAFCECSG